MFKTDHIPIKSIEGVGPKVELLLNKLDIFSIKDCIYFFPREYDDRRKLWPLTKLHDGITKTVVGTIETIQEKKVKKGVHIIEAMIADQSGKIKAIWFNQAYLIRVLIPGKKVLIRGKCEENMFAQILQMQVQMTEIIHSKVDFDNNVGLIVPIYRLTAGLYQSQIRDIINKAIKKSLQLIVDQLPAYIKNKYNLIELNKAIYQLHYPQSVDGYKESKKRVIFDEFFYYQLKLERQRMEYKKNKVTNKISVKKHLINQFIDLLPYELTTAQKTVSTEILSDLDQPFPMNRLLQGDVGSGKTDVAIITLLAAIENKLSAVIMAPTEILATQHYNKMKLYLEQINVISCLLTGKMKQKEKNKMLDIINSKVPCIIIGTHALIEKYITFDRCGVVIIDEQHRFGVIQRIALQEKAQNPHCLFMTATPIPRSFMLTCFGDLDKSIINEMPPGRVPIQTKVISENQLNHIFEFCRQRLLEGEQLYIVFPLIDESEKIDLKSAIEGYEKLKSIFSDFKVGLLHGKLKSVEKEDVMTEFKANRCHILVSTTVIEVGIDVPNATIMMINDAERFGLSQLHQLRGRVGRGNRNSMCFLVSSSRSEMAKKRLKSMEQTSDGFKIAEYDLSLRGPGDILGTKQSGIPKFYLGDIVKDESTLLLARKLAKYIYDKDPTLSSKDHIGLKHNLSLLSGMNINNKLN